MHYYGYYYKNKNNFKDEDTPSNYTVDRLSIILSLYASMKDEKFDFIVNNMKKALK